jgi:hypothetical protein
VVDPPGCWVVVVELVVVQPPAPGVTVVVVVELLGGGGITGGVVVVVVVLLLPFEFTVVFVVLCANESGMTAKPVTRTRACPSIIRAMRGLFISRTPDAEPRSSYPCIVIGRCSVFECPVPR